MSFSFKSFLPHILIILGFVVVSLLYFSPVLEGKKIFQSDIMHYIGMAEQHKQFAKTEGQETYWTNSAFGGMPTYQLGAKYPHNYIKKLDLALRFLPRPADYLFLYFIGFYILLLSLKVDFKLAALGALAFGFSTYLIIILGVGHNSKAHAIGYMPLVLAGIILTFRKKYILGVLLTAVALGLEIVANHPQMTYYLLFLVIVLGIAYLIDAYKKQKLPHFFKSIGLLTIATLIAVGLNATGLMATKEYAAESTRGESDLTINADGSQREITSGLSREYITEYSYGILETFNLYIPCFMGGGSYEDVGKDSETYKAYLNLGASPIEAIDASRSAPMYWGDQTIVEAPAYVGAVIIFLFVLGLFLVKGRLKWWLVGGVFMSWLLSLGKNWFFVENPSPDSNPITNFFIDYVPLYDKFRAVSSIQVILELCIPILGIFALVRLFNDFQNNEYKLKALKRSLIITAGIALLFLVGHSVLLDFEGARDDQYAQAYGQAFVDALVEDRKSLLVTDSFRTLILVLLSASVVYAYLKRKLSQNVTILFFAILILFDLVAVNLNYVNADNFVSARKVDKPYQATTADKNILKDDGHFRVLDVSSDGQRRPARAAYFHNSLSGYHAAKLKRFEALFDFHISKNNPEVLNMLNTKYVILGDESGRVEASSQYTQPNGNAWFISKLRPVASGDEEILALDSLKTKSEAVILKSSFSDSKLNTTYKVDSVSQIILMDYKPNHLTYKSQNENQGFAVFSEMYYNNGWNAYINGDLVPHFRVNYALRGLNIPKGDHKIEFKFEPKVVATGSKITLATSILLMVLMVVGVVFGIKSLRTKAD